MGDDHEGLSTDELLKLFEDGDLPVDDATLMESMAGPTESIEVRLPKALLKTLDDVSEHETLSSQLRVALFQYLSEHHGETLDETSKTFEPDETIQTDSGLKAAGDVKISQQLRGVVMKEIQAIESVDASNVLRIVTDDGAIELSANHELLVIGTDGAVDLGLKPASELQPGDRLVRTAHISQVFPENAGESD